MFPANGVSVTGPAPVSVFFTHTMRPLLKAGFGRVIVTPVAPEIARMIVTGWVSATTVLELMMRICAAPRASSRARSALSSAPQAFISPPTEGTVRPSNGVDGPGILLDYGRHETSIVRSVSVDIELVQVKSVTIHRCARQHKRRVAGPDRSNNRPYVPDSACARECLLDHIDDSSVRGELRRRGSGLESLEDDGVGPRGIFVGGRGSDGLGRIHRSGVHEVCDAHGSPWRGHDD